MGGTAGGEAESGATLAGEITSGLAESPATIRRGPGSAPAAHAENQAHTAAHIQLRLLSLRIASIARSS
jgi:hypothetical protein